ncbi:hypothetical protein MACH08_20010 [Oceanobacillus kimchii]|uniref:Uncharacterized protein n=1 Tax=Oceanobacillus kimchii TaxID=746691 RepID=A0ABQ5TJD9_9BACI|nr:hypothetical protein MACH08_20010 [Oceanobacillus kimchii]
MRTIKIQCIAKLKYKDDGYSHKLSLKYKYKHPSNRFYKRKQIHLFHLGYGEVGELNYLCDKYLKIDTLKKLIVEDIQNTLRDDSHASKAEEKIEQIKKLDKFDFEFEIK